MVENILPTSAKNILHGIGKYLYSEWKSNYLPFQNPSFSELDNLGWPLSLCGPPPGWSCRWGRSRDRFPGQGQPRGLEFCQGHPSTKVARKVKKKHPSPSADFSKFHLESVSIKFHRLSRNYQNFILRSCESLHLF